MALAMVSEFPIFYFYYILWKVINDMFSISSFPCKLYIVFFFFFSLSKTFLTWENAGGFLPPLVSKYNKGILIFLFLSPLKLSVHWIIYLRKKPPYASSKLNSSYSLLTISSSAHNIVNPFLASSTHRFSPF